MICCCCKHIKNRRELLYEVEVGDAIAHRAEKGGSILHEDEVALLVHSPHKIGELYLREVLQTESTWKSDFIKGAIYGTMVLVGAWWT